MKNNLFIISLMSIFFISCLNKQTSKSIQQMPTGEFNKEFDDHVIYSLTLKEDYTFIYSIKGGAFSNTETKCNGKWQIKQNEILLDCNTESLLNQISSGYMTTRKFKAKLINEKTLKLDEIYLNKK